MGKSEKWWTPIKDVQKPPACLTTEAWPDFKGLTEADLGKWIHEIAFILSRQLLQAPTTASLSSIFIKRYQRLFK